MAEFNCCHCFKSVSRDTPIVVCDGCSLNIHCRCLKISENEIAFISQSRSPNIKLFCNRCNVTITAISEIKKLVNDIKSSFDERLSKLESLIINNNTSQAINREEIIAESVDRSARACNVIMYNVKPVANKQDVDVVIDPSLVIGSENVFRVGKTVGDKPRLLKLQFKTQQMARLCLKKKSSLLQHPQFAHITISDDKTPGQLKHLNNLRDELKRRLDVGEKDLTIKYVNHVPKIIHIKKLNIYPCSMALLYTNIASLSSKFNDLLLEVTEFRPSIIALTETWLNPSISDDAVHIENYSIYRDDRLSQKGGGVCFYVDKIKISKFFKITQICISVKPYDSLWLKFEGNEQTFVIACIYRPPTGASFNNHENDKNLFNTIQSTINQYPNLIIMGDFNFPCIDWSAKNTTGQTIIEKQFSELLLENNLSQIVTEPTRFRSQQRPSLLDLVILSDVNLVSSLNVSNPVGTSDHAKIEIELQIMIYSEPYARIKTTSIVDYTRIDESLLTYDWNGLDSLNAEEQWKHFKSILQTCITTNSRLFTNRLRKDKPWINQHMLDKIKYKAKLWKKFKRKPTEDNFSAYKRFSNQLKSDLQIARCNYENSILNKPKLFYSHVPPGPDQIPPKLLRTCAASLSGPLAKMMTKSFLQGTLPYEWLQATITPLYKSGDKLDPANYRPVSLTSTCCKIMEKVIVKELLTYMRKNNLIPEHQHGFLPGRSVVTNLLSCTNLWTKMLDTNQPVDIIYLDFSKAFDKVPHNLLLAKLESYGVTGNLLDWIRAFLSNRNYCVKVCGKFSYSKPVLSGVPQGSVLGPILFLLYTPDLLFSLDSYSAYADDIKLFANPLVTDLQDQLNLIFQWSEKWQIPLNIAKCCVLQCGHNNPKYLYHINGTLLSVKTSTKDLGVIVNDKLGWSEQCLASVGRARKMFYLLKHVFPNPSVSFISKVYITYIRPHLEFAIPVWRPYLLKDIDLLERTQHLVTRWTHCLRQVSYEQRLEILKIPDQRARQNRADAIQIFRLTHGLFPGVTRNFLQIQYHDRLRGHSYKLKKEPFKTTVRKNYLTNRAFDIWNGLPDNVVAAVTVSSFKNQYDTLQ
ncbi:hypothetical protein TcasGA2_TC005244 [Tribolium castaneum]|uniref:Reverse transcriptase domain-containing protein n=1 Tax=Tribolium castaneum TaxID=7070 RepID=D7ELX0_TRICA|nr:hypothetical protein TcasGA2_TC005244 [Tribolium castaneum]